MRSGNKVIFLGLLILGSSLCVSSLCQAAEPLTVIRCLDGDTLELSDGEIVSLIGVDTPEASNNFKLWRDAKVTAHETKEILAKGQEAADFTRQLAQGKQVRLEYDVQQKDKYGRTLAYVYILVCKNCNVPSSLKYEYVDMADPDETRAVYLFLNATLIKAGYSQVVTVPPNVKYQELFLKLEKEAIAQNMGLWRDASEGDKKKLGYTFGLEDVTGLGSVRASNAKVGVDYKVSKNATVGVEAKQGLHDGNDASAWGKSVDDETAAQAKYKLSF